MKHIRLPRLLSFLLSFALLIAPLPLSAMAEYIVVPISDLQSELTIVNSDHTYIYLGKELSNIGSVLSAISTLETYQNSPLIQLNNYIEKGLFLANHDDIADILYYAENVLQNNCSTLDPLKAEQL